MSRVVDWELGVDIRDPEFGGILPTIVTQSDVYQYLDSTMTQVEAVQRDFLSNGTALPQDFLKNWSDFVDEWRIFYTQEKADTHYLGAATIMEQIDGYVERIKTFQTQAKTVGSAAYNPVAPGVTEDPNSEHSDANKETQSLIKTIAIFGGGAIGLLALAKLIRG
jgi:hypothetical protein